jgi:hypothetical protein
VRLPPERYTIDKEDVRLRFKRRRVILNPVVETNRQVEVRLKTGRNAVPAKAGTHGKYIR